MRVCEDDCGDLARIERKRLAIERLERPGPWNRPQSIRMARPSYSSSMHEPVTVPAAPWKVILGSVFVTARSN